MEQPVSSGHTFSCETEIQATCRSHEDILRDVHPDRRTLHFEPSGEELNELPHFGHFDGVGL
ncbi:hypothetical protein KAF44_27940 (plasmid) [Cupriavidus necator]|nr:hypothetical protein KAF44_11750 [Cupriavidus necator]UIF89020.1 hypothetical protein KAF44_27940 [Cupriavidus necator]